MARLVASELALRSLLAASQRPTGVRTAELAAMLDAPFSSAERALEMLAEDGLVERADHRTRLVDPARAGEAVRFALSFLQPDDALGALARANPGVEFCGSDRECVLLVIRRFAEPADEARLGRTFPDRTRRGNLDAPGLGRLHPTLSAPSCCQGADDLLLERRGPRTGGGLPVPHCS